MQAIIDIGSNSVRLMMYRGELITPKIIRTTMLAENLQNTGFLSNEAMARTLQAIVFFVEKAKTENADTIRIFGTEAMRSAKNAGDFRLEIEKATALPVTILSGNEEAKLGLLGVYNAFKPSNEITVVDIGGASVEVIRGDDKRVTYVKSLPLGVARLKNMAGDNRSDIEKLVKSRLHEFGIISGIEGIAIGGTATTLASIALNQSTYNPYEIHGYELSLGVLDKIATKLFNCKNIPEMFPTVSPQRAKVIPHGAIMLLYLIDFLGLDSITVSESDNLEGFLHFI